MMKPSSVDLRPSADVSVAMNEELDINSRAKLSPERSTNLADFGPQTIVLHNGFTYRLDPPAKPIANAGPIGLMAFGITTTLLNIVNAGLVNSSAIAIVVAYGALHGGLVQVLAGMWEIKRGNTFAGVAFSTYGGFWLGFAMLQIMLAAGLFPAVDLQGGLCAWLCLWGVFTIMMLISTWRINRALQVVFGTLTILFFLLAGGEYNAGVKKAAGWVGIICGLSAMYTGWAELTNDMFEMEVLPLFSTKPKRAHHSS